MMERIFCALARNSALLTALRVTEAGAGSSTIGGAALIATVIVSFMAAAADPDTAARNFLFLFLFSVVWISGPWLRNSVTASAEW
jgi:hypothetical protein